MSSADRRRQILQVAETQILTRGAQSVTMEGIAEAISVAKPVVYRHFPSAEALLLAVLQQYWAEIDAHSGGRTPDDMPLDEYLRHSAGSYFVELESDRKGFRALLLAAVSTAAGMEAWLKRYTSRVRRYARKLEHSLQMSPSRAYQVSIMTLGGLTALGNTPMAPVETEGRMQAYIEFALAMARAVEPNPASPPDKDKAKSP